MPETALFPLHSSHSTQFPRLAPGADTPRGRPGGRPLGVSHQHSASCPRRLLNDVSSALPEPVWPVPYSLVMTPTVGAESVETARASCENAGISAVCAPGWCPRGAHSGAHTHINHSSQLHRPESEKKYHVPPIHAQPVTITPESFKKYQESPTRNQPVTIAPLPGSK